MLAYILRRLLLDHPDAVRHHGDQLRHRAGRARRPGRADDRQAARHGGRRHRARLGRRRGRRVARQRGGRPNRAPAASTAARAGSTRSSSSSIEKLYGFDKPALERFVLMMKSYIALRLRRELLPATAGGRPGAREDAGVDLARPVDHAADLSRLHPARHRQGGARRLALRRLDQRRDHRGANAIPGFLFAILLIVLFAGGSYFQWFPAARPRLRQLGEPRWPRARSLDYFWHMALPIAALVIGGFAGAHHAHQELLPRGDRQAVRDDGARQGAQRSAACSTATSSATPC